MLFRPFCLPVLPSNQGCCAFSGVFLRSLVNLRFSVARFTPFLISAGQLWLRFAPLVRRAYNGQDCRDIRYEAYISSDVG